MTNKQELLRALQPILEFLEGKEFTPELERELQERFPLESAHMQRVKINCMEGLKYDWLCPREGDKLRYGRLAKSSETINHIGIDTVEMNDVVPGHTHPLGEVDHCFAVQGKPLFDGNPEGWTVYGKNSWHIPTVTDGTMAILYFLPQGAIQFKAKPTR